MIKNLIKNKTVILIIIIVGLLLSNISVNHRYQSLITEQEEKMFAQGMKQMSAIMSDFCLFSTSFINGSYTHNFFYSSSPIDSPLREESIRSMYYIAKSLDLQSFRYLFESMLNVYELYKSELIPIEELEFLLMSLNQDVIMLVDLYKPFSEKETYRKVQGLDSIFHKKEKEFMDNLIEKYHNLTAEDIE